MSASLILYSNFRFVRKGEIRHGRPYSAIVLTYFFEQVVHCCASTPVQVLLQFAHSLTHLQSHGVAAVRIGTLGPKKILQSLSGATFVRITCGALNMLIMGATLYLVHQCLWK